MKSFLRTIKYSLTFPIRVMKNRWNLYPICTNESNSFDFDSKLLQITAFVKILGPDCLSNDANSFNHSECQTKILIEEDITYFKYL